MKPYQALPIQDCNEPLVPIDSQQLAFVEPAPYEKLGAPYEGKSPYYLRQGVLQALLQAQSSLSKMYPGWRIQIFDAYRPVAVQQFMVDYTLADLARQRGLLLETLTNEQRKTLQADVYEFWAPPSLDPATPPPHSTGAALDVTLVDESGAAVEMGSPIDEVSPRSFPDHFATATTDPEHRWHQHRTMLNQVMQTAGFRRHPKEWWHFSLGDQLWAWLMQQETGNDYIYARYGRWMGDYTSSHS